MILGCKPELWTRSRSETSEKKEKKGWTVGEC